MCSSTERSGAPTRLLRRGVSVSASWLIISLSVPLDASTANAPSESVDLHRQTYIKARTAFANRQFEEAAESYELYLRSGDSRYGAEAQVSLGLAYQKLERCDDAIRTLSEVLKRPEPESASENWLLRNHKASAQWGIALCLMAKREYRSALQAIKDSATKYPPESFCGNAHWQDAYRNALYRGLTLEHLKVYPSAVQSYLDAALGEFEDPTASIRLADLYEATGQFDDLKEFAHHLEPRHTLRRAVELRDLEHRGDLEALVVPLRARARVLGPPWESHVRMFEWEAGQAAALLARHPPATLPLLKTELNRVGDHGFVYYALGLCATPEASAVLKEALLDKEKAGYVMTLNYALTLAGKRGRAVLDELSRSHPEAVTYRSYPFPVHWFLEVGIEFPNLPRTLRLPALHEMKPPSVPPGP